MSTGTQVFTPRRFASGAESVKAADALRRMQERRDLWPYPDQYGPPDSIRRNPTGSVLIPAIGFSAVILAYQVDQGFQFDLTHLMFCPVTTGYVPIGNPGDYTFTVNRNTPATGTAPQGSPLADLQAVPFPFGSPLQRFVKLSRAEHFGPTDIIRIFGNNVSGAAGAPNFFVAALMGWERPA